MKSLKGEIIGYKAEGQVALKMGTKVNISVNGKPIKLKNLHCSITSNGFDHHGNRMFNSADVQNKVQWILFILSYGNSVNTSNYSYTVDNQHRRYSHLQAPNSGNWTGGNALITNTSSPSASDIVASATWSAVAHQGGDWLDTYWDWGMAGTGMMGWQSLGDLIFNHAGSVATFDDISLRDKSDDSEWKRSAGSYTKTSSTVHYIEATFTPDALNPKIGKVRLYSAATETYCYEYIFTAVKQPVQGTTITIRITFTLS